MRNLTTILLIVLFIMGLLTGYATHGLTSNKTHTVIIYTDWYIHTSQVSDSVYKYSKQGYKVRVIELDSTNFGYAMDKGIRYLPYVERVE